LRNGVHTLGQDEISLLFVFTRGRFSMSKILHHEQWNKSIRMKQ
jgi:hypothetical protein